MLLYLLFSMRRLDLCSDGNGCEVCVVCVFSGSSQSSFCEDLSPGVER